METDCFNTRYYWLNRKTLTLLGQWPYQNYSDRVILWILYMCLMATGVIVQKKTMTQIARAVKAEEVDFDLCIEFICEALASSTLIVRYYTYTVYNGKIKGLLDNMKIDWQRITNENEHQILCESTEATKIFVVQYMGFVCSGTLMFSITMLSSPLLIYTPFFNESCPVLMMYSKEFIVDPQKYCFPLLLHICIFISVLLLGAVWTDIMYMVILYHIVGMFKIVCYRLEHVFDLCTDESKYSSGRMNVYDRIASAVECHRNAIRFGEDVGETFQWPNLISLVTTMLSIAVALYWAATSKGQGLKPVFAMTISGGAMIHMFFTNLSSQRMIDNSEAVIFRAYSSMWYTAPAREQSLLLLTMQRGLKPCAIVMGKLHAATLENFAADIQASFSYFTLLLSME